MPRQPDGSFLRYNSQFSGPDVWQKDLDTDTKIIALRHDIHDEDLAVGISECLPKDGAEPMLGALNLGGFKVNNIADAESLDVTSAAAFGQTITQASFNDGSRQLTLSRANMLDLVVTIPSGGDNTTILNGLQVLSIGSGLEFLSGNAQMSEANPDDTILLANSGVAAGSYINPNMTVDAKGRVTAITSGSGFIGTDLSATRSATTVSVASSTGADATIQAATEALAGVMSAQDKVTVNALKSASGSFVPALEGVTVSNIGSMSWFRVGDMVTVFGIVQWANLNDTDPSQVWFSGLPYDVASGANASFGSVSSARDVDFGAVDDAGNLTILGLKTIAGTDWVGLTVSYSNGSPIASGEVLNMTYQQFDPTGFFTCMLVYKTNQDINTPN